MKQALRRLGDPDCTSGNSNTRHSHFRQLSKLTGHTSEEIQLMQQGASTHKYDAGNGSWAHKITICNLPYMDGYPECIPGRCSGQQFFQGFSSSVIALDSFVECLH
jgi:hypothetical protein